MRANLSRGRSDGYCRILMWINRDVPTQSVKLNEQSGLKLSSIMRCISSPSCAWRGMLLRRLCSLALPFAWPPATGTASRSSFYTYRTVLKEEYSTQQYY